MILGRDNPALENHMLLAFTELRTKEEIDQLVKNWGISMLNQNQPLIFESSKARTNWLYLPELMFRK